MSRAIPLRLAFAAFLLMTLPNAPAHAAERAIDKDVLVEAPLDTVWSAWTTREGITGFFAPDAEIDARVGGAFHIFINPYAPAGTKGADTMQFLAIQPKTMLSFDWNAPPSLPFVRGQRTVVILRFTPDGERTRVSLHHVGWGDPAGSNGKEWDDAYRYFDRAWGNVLANLQKRYAPGGAPIDWTDWLRQMKAATPAAS